MFAHLQGTSASSPIVASIIALLNDRLASAGRPPMGFLNPWLYKEGWQAFTDVTTGGSSVQCSGGVPVHQINATEGWDPVRDLLQRRRAVELIGRHRLPALGRLSLTSC